MKIVIFTLIAIMFSKSLLAEVRLGDYRAMNLQKEQLKDIKDFREGLGISDDKPLLLLQQGDDWMLAGPRNFDKNIKMKPVYIPINGIANSLKNENILLKNKVKQQREIIVKLKEAIEELRK